MGVTPALERFASEVGAAGPVCCAGGRTQWDVGGSPEPGTREVAAPSGVVAHEPAEMIVRVRAGTSLGELSAALAERGQQVSLEGERHATVGGLVAVGRSGVRRLGLGPSRDAVLEVTAVNARGELIRSGAPLVKNVTGFDLCRLLTGSLGMLALLGELVLRCHPLPEVERWYRGEGADPFELHASLYRPLAVLWDGAAVWVGLAGFRVDVDEQARKVLGGSFSETAGPPQVALPHRRSLPPARLRELAGAAGAGGSFLAEVGVGVVHCDAAVSAALGPADPPPPAVLEIHRRIKANFDPQGRLNPGRQLFGPGTPPDPVSRAGR